MEAFKELTVFCIWRADCSENLAQDLIVHGVYGPEKEIECTVSYVKLGA